MAETTAGTEHLVAALRAPGEGASFVATLHAGLARVEPLTRRADAWMRDYASAESSWDGPALVVEMQYFPAFADAAIDAGHTFERSAQPN